tara:strand:- start:425 stop:727 length:303 start_codon:yes stop_codon:yes gene_type:complete
MAIYSAGTSIGNAGTVLGSAANLTSVPAGTTSAGDTVGSYGLLYINSGTQNNTVNATIAGTNLLFSSVSQHATTQGSGTWRLYGRTASDSHRASVFHRYV